MSKLLQTRVRDRVAREFKRAARSRGLTSAAYLHELIEDAVAEPKPHFGHPRRPLPEDLSFTPEAYSLMAKLRDTASSE